MTANIDVHTDIAHKSKLWLENPCLDYGGIIALALSVGGFEGQAAEVSIVLADNNFVQGLNCQYRGKDKPTNILSFPQDAEDFCLGDLVLAYEIIAQEAQEQEKAFSDHLTHLIVHGTLHLLGYDHETPEEAEEMEGIEIQALKELGISNPYDT